MRPTLCQWEREWERRESGVKAEENGRRGKGRRGHGGGKGDQDRVFALRVWDELVRSTGAWYMWGLSAEGEQMVRLLKWDSGAGKQIVSREERLHRAGRALGEEGEVEGATHTHTSAAHHPTSPHPHTPGRRSA
eukprot:236966-Chlamydomonas_euryale.AAC.2